MALDFGRSVVGICAAAAILATPAHALAQLTPGLKLCSFTDSAQMVASEKFDLDQRLPSAYHNFTIVRGQNNRLRVVVPFETLAMAEKHVPVEKIMDTWESVLGAHHRDCGYSNLSVEFVNPNGKELLTAETER
jgi:hypothetical protein